VTLVRRESARRLGFRPAQVAQRIVNGLGGATVAVTGCHFLPLVDVRGKHQVICAFEVEEISTVAETRLPPWAKEVFPSVRAHMPWMDMPAGPIELLIGLDNSQWLPVFLEDSKEPSQGGRGRGRRGRGGMIGPQPQGPVYPQPFGMPGLLQPPGHADPVQRLALMMALMVLGMPPVYSCRVPTGCGMPLGADMSEPKVCPPIDSETGIGISAMKKELDEKQWVRLPAVHCVAMQSSLSFMCGLDGRTKKV
jgi:hypothetical protein